ncbi:probable LRR receptor-like serine/threonine-protein kinase At1g56140 isoform X3 [Fagus crenata]
MVGSSPLLVLAFCAACIFGQVFELAQAQNQTKAATDPAEVRALNSIFQKWGISAASGQWNISGEPCSGAAIDSTSFDDKTYNPFIKCDCSSDSNTTCHITQLRVYAQDVAGVIPQELWNLTFLFNLDLGQNYLTGNLSASIGNLYRMQYLSLGINALSGTLPKELGNLTNLLSLSFSTNNFTGSLPSELGNLVKLQQLYFDSSGVSGAIPSTFANLKNLQTVWASDTELNGRIPDFIGNLSKLTVLRFEGNSFEGPIPSTFSNLTSLTDLRISDLSNGSSSLAFIKDMKSLSNLVLRNNNISDSIPSNIGEYQKLAQLFVLQNEMGFSPKVVFICSCIALLQSLAWQLHENNHEVDLVDSNLSEFNEEEVQRVIGVSLLCIQAPPILRPSMSRVVAMLLGDIELSTVTSKPGYLTDWKFNGPTSLSSDVAARRTGSIYYDSSESTRMVGNIDNSPASASKPMLGMTVKEGR